MKIENAVNAYNAIRGSSALLTARLPQANLQNIVEAGNPILEYVPVQNEFLDALVNKIYLQVIHNRSFNNPLAILKRGSAPLGSDIEEIHVNPVQASQYNPTAETLLKQHAPDAAAAYHRLNRQDVYKLTVERTDLRQAFTSWQAFGDMIEANINALYSGNYIDEFRLMLNLFSGGLSASAITTQIIEAPIDASTAKQLVSRMRALNRKFQLPSTEYNAYPLLVNDPTKTRTTWCKPEDIIVIISADTEALLDVEVLAAAFNMDRAEFIANNVLIVDSFGVDSPIQAVMIDRSYVQVYDNLYIAEPFRNPETLSVTYFLHVWQTYSASPFANAVAFITEYTELTVQPADWATDYDDYFTKSGTSYVAVEGVDVYTLQTAQPSDWTTNYTSYYTKSGDDYVAVTGDSAPAWAADTYYTKSEGAPQFLPNTYYKKNA